MAAGAIALFASTFAAAAPLGFIAMRVYLPPGGSTANITPPTLVFENTDGTSKTILPCANQTAALAEMARVGLEKQTECAWAGGYGIDGRVSINVAAPDDSAKYWVTPFLPVESLKRIRIKGKFPDARYLSFVTYNSKSTTWLPLSENPQLTDYEITPDAGYMNPWQQPALAGGRFTVDIVRNPAEAETNYLPMPPPEEGGIIDIVKAMPEPLANCQPGNPCLPTSKFLRPGEALEAGMGPNSDSGYLMSRNNFGRGVVQVVRGKLPRIAKGSTPQSWLDSGNQLRYASFCTYPVMKPYPLAACIKDEDLKLDRDGYYTLVIGAPLDRPLSVIARGDNWLPHYPSQLVDHMVLMRNMVELNFPQAVQNVPKDNSPSSAASVMQAYYPTAKLCTVMSYQLLGKNCKAL